MLSVPIEPLPGVMEPLLIVTAELVADPVPEKAPLLTAIDPVPELVPAKTSTPFVMTVTPA